VPCLSTIASLHFRLVNMSAGQNTLVSPASGPRPSMPANPGLYLSITVVCLSLFCALAIPKGYALDWIGDMLQAGLLVLILLLALQNALRSHGEVRAFWMMLCLGSAMWLSSQMVWSIYELGFRRPLPDSPLVDFLLFLKLVPLTAAAFLDPQKSRDLRLRAFGLLDLAILIIYAFYLFVFFVYAYRMLPGGLDVYNSRFNIADAIGNLLLATLTGLAFFRERGPWRPVFRLYFLGALVYAVGSSMNDVTIDQRIYYTGSLFDLPLVAGMAGFAWMCLAARPLLSDEGTDQEASSATGEPSRPFKFLSSHLAMLVTVSTPAIGLWLLATHSGSEPFFTFRLDITLLTILLLALLLSLKQDLLSANLVGSLQSLSHTYSSIDRFKDHLVQSEKLATLGESVASVAHQIGDSMIRIQEQASLITTRAGSESRSGALAAKISHYAQRTDSLAENMQRFAQEAPLQLAPVAVKPLLETALHLSRISKMSNLRVVLREENQTPSVLGDSSQLLHVFLQIISNAMDALQEVGGGELLISISPCEPQVCIQFADSGPGIQHPQRVFEPFFTTKPVGQGTGLGLSTCYGIIRQHNGDISCGNRLEGGAFFTLFLPSSTAPLADPQDGNPVVLEKAQ
jgi:signal transduction histidine kinase